MRPRSAGCLVAMLALIWLVPGAMAASEAELRAAMIYNIARFVKWPAAELAKSERFTICALGENDVADALGALRGKQLHDRPVSILRVRGDSDLAHCDVIYLAAAQSLRLSAVLSVLEQKDASTLTVGDAPNFLTLGGAVQLLTQAGKPRFRIARRHAERRGLSVNAKLLQLALPEV